MPSPKGSDRNSFERIERKFIIPRDEGEELIRLLQDRVPPSYPTPGTPFNEIESIYFDSPELDVYRRHFQPLGDRFKLRTRTYGPGGAWDRDCVFLEMKMKKGEMTEKFRVRLDPASHQTLFEENDTGLALTRALQMVNPSTELRVLARRVQQIDVCLQQLRLRPHLRLVYRRRAFEDNGLRITLDENVRAELLAEISPELRMEIVNSSMWSEAERMATQYPITEGLILEVKNRGAVPDWVLEPLRENRVTEARFSKYCYSITSSISDGLLLAPTRTQAMPLGSVSPMAMRSVPE